MVERKHRTTRHQVTGYELYDPPIHKVSEPSSNSLEDGSGACRIQQAGPED